MEIKTFYMTQDELRKLLWDDKNPNWYNSYAIPLIEDKYNQFYFKGFKYFSPDCLNERNTIGNYEFIVAFDEDKLIGVIKYGIYNCGEGNYWGLNYISVHVRYKGMGIARTLIQRFNESLNNSMDLRLSSMSAEGGEVNINSKFVKYITNTKVINPDLIYEKI